MKKVFALLLLLIVILSSCAVDNDDEPEKYIEAFTCVKEFDGIEFDFEAFVENANFDEKITVKENEISLENGISYRSCFIHYGNRDILCFNIYSDVDTAKERFQTQLDGWQIMSRYAVLIRVNNVIIIPPPFAESNARVAKFAKDIGIASSDNVIKVHESEKYISSATNKSIDEILTAMEERGYSAYKYDTDYESTYMYKFISENGAYIYELIVVEESMADMIMSNVIQTRKEIPSDCIQHYYSLSFEYSVMFMGSSLGTEQLWDEIR